MQAEACDKEALRLGPDHADAWVHLGNRRFEEERVVGALAFYERGQAAAERRTIGDPDTYPHSVRGDVDSRPLMRALHGRGLCLWRLGRTEEVCQILARMLKLNPNETTTRGLAFFWPTWMKGAFQNWLLTFTGFFLACENLIETPSLIP